MVTLFEENIKTVACTTWNECKLKSGVQTPAAEEMQGRIHRSGVKKQRKAQTQSSNHLEHPSIISIMVRHHRDGRPVKESH